MGKELAAVVLLGMVAFPLAGRVPDVAAIEREGAHVAMTFARAAAREIAAEMCDGETKAAADAATIAPKRF